MSFIHYPEIGELILTQWLTIQDIVQLDNAYCNHDQRKLYYKLYQCILNPLFPEIQIPLTLLATLLQWCKTRHLNNPFQRLALYRNQIDPKPLLTYGLDTLIHLERLQLSVITPGLLYALSSLYQLKELSFTHIHFTTQEIISLGILFKLFPVLQSISFNQCECSSILFAYLLKLPKLTQLTLINLDLNKESFQYISQLVQLQTLTLQYIHTKHSSDYHSLISLTQLHQLTIIESNITSSEIQQILRSNQTQLISLSLTHCFHILITEELILLLCQCLKLQYLDISGLTLPDQWLNKLLQCQHLKYLRITSDGNEINEINSMENHISYS